MKYDTSHPHSQITGTFLRVVYKDAGSDWAIIELAGKAGGIEHACGEIDIQPIVGEALTLFGEWSRYRNRGRVFGFMSFRAVAPRDPEFFTQYLSSLGQLPLEAAQMVVDAFRDESLVILSRSPERLSEIQGFKDSYRERLISNWTDLRKADHLSDAMAKSGLNPDLIADLSYRLPPESEAQTVVSDDPWLIYLYTDSSFAMVKEYVSNTGPVDVGHYAEAGIIAVCRRALNKGHNQVKTEEARGLAPRLLGLGSELTDEQFDAAIGWLMEQDFLDRKGDGLILTEVRRTHAAIEQRLRQLQAEANEVTDQLTTKQLRRILSCRPETEHLVSELETLHDGLTRKVVFFQAANVSIEDLVEHVVDGLQSDLHFEILKISADSDSRPKSSVSPPSILGPCPYGPPKRGPHAPFDAEMVIIFRSHLFPNTTLNNILDACSDDAVVILVGNCLSENLHVAGRPLQIVVDHVHQVNLDWLCRNAGKRGIKQIVELVAGEWDPSLYENNLDFDLKLITIDCPDDEIAANVTEVCSGELVDSLGLDKHRDSQIIVPAPSNQDSHRLYEQIEQAVAPTLQLPGVNTASSHRAMLKSPINRANLALYQVGQLHRESLDKATFELKGRQIVLHGSEIGLAGYAMLVQMAHAQHIHVPLIIVPLTSTETITNSQLLDAINCSGSWTFLVGATRNVINRKLWTDHEL